MSKKLPQLFVFLFFTSVVCLGQEHPILTNILMTRLYVTTTIPVDPISHKVLTNIVKQSFSFDLSYNVIFPKFQSNMSFQKFIARNTKQQLEFCQTGTYCDWTYSKMEAYIIKNMFTPTEYTNRFRQLRQSQWDSLVSQIGEEAAQQYKNGVVIPDKLLWQYVCYIVVETSLDLIEWKELRWRFSLDDKETENVGCMTCGIDNRIEYIRNVTDQNKTNLFLRISLVLAEPVPY